MTTATQASLCATPQPEIKPRGSTPITCPPSRWILDGPGEGHSCSCTATRTWNLEVPYTKLGGYGALCASTQVLTGKLSVWSWDLLAVGQALASRVDSDLPDPGPATLPLACWGDPDFLPTFQATQCQPAVGVKCIRVTLGFRSRVSKTVAVTVLLFRTGAKLTSTV
jgi:hypothetical protein